MKLIPIYTENVKGRQNYTIFIDKQTNLTYKAYQKEPSQATYWIAFFIVLAILRGIQEVSISISNIGAIFIFLTLLISGIFSGIFFNKKYVYEEVREIYLTESMIKEYIERGKKGFKLEIRIAVISLLVVLILAFLFFITHGIILLIFLYFSLYIYVVYQKKDLSFINTKEPLELDDGSTLHYRIDSKGIFYFMAEERYVYQEEMHTQSIFSYSQGVIATTATFALVGKGLGSNYSLPKKVSDGAGVVTGSGSTFGAVQ
ncbi:hypothetical protein QGM71_16960 [Virgibacillus sp. C22-A2]|uniref:Uncharacterized protein n=1 Tax=Virgibacillus tibetensis TaxID=3042313 RepID=A0ABU6KJ87_9BACI|nr:hypothetical protein [Virgibacillus sp. C22-A2]